MLTTITKDSFPQFVSDIAQRINNSQTVSLEYLSTEEMFIYTQEYTSGSNDATYDMSDNDQRSNFFADLKAGK